MRAIWITKAGGPDVLEVREGPDPEPRDGEVRVRVRAAGLNFAEIMARKGLYPDAPKRPSVVGYEVAGDIDAVGDGVPERPGARVGDRVAALVRFGGHADVVCVPADQCFEMPSAMSYAEGAALPVNYLTAYHMLFEIRRVRPGEAILVHQAAGGVGTAVLQLCRTVPDVVTFGTASGGKHDYVREHGCDHPIDYRSTDYAAEVRRLTADRVGGPGVDLVLDALGGPDWRKGYDLLRSTGTLIAFGWANMSGGERRSFARAAGQIARMPILTLPTLMNDNRALAGVNMGHLWHMIPLLQREGDALMKLYAEGKIRPHVDASFAFAQASDAHRYLEHGQSVGKVILTP